MMKIIKKFSRRGQEELVGFALIVIIVSLIILGILFFALRGSEKKSVESFEIESFIQSSLQYTTECSTDYGNLSVRELTFECINLQRCSDGKFSCDVLNSTLQSIIDSNWQINNGPIKGYTYSITSNNYEILTLKKGNETESYKGALQDFSRGTNSIKISLRIYY